MKLDSTAEAAKLRAEIDEAKVKVKALMGQIKNREGRLRRIAADAFSTESEPINGITAEVREIVLGLEACPASPIGICVYSNRAMSLPGQREVAAWHKEHGHTTADAMKKWGPATHTDACLFCGTKA